MAKKKPAARPATRSNRSTKPAAKGAGKSAARKLPKPAAKGPAKGKSSTARGQSQTTIAVASSTGALPMFVVDAFTARPFHGNPAAVVVVADAPPSDEVMQAISAENNLSETAFVIMGKTGPRIRWFTPTTEVDLCGHATLAAAHVLWQHFDIDTDDLTFASRSGKLDVSRLDVDLYELDFPARPGTAVPITREMSAAIGRMPAAAYIADDLMLVLDNRRDVYDLHMDHVALAKLPGRGVIVTAPGSGHDFVSRCFYPRLGIAEDPVTGSAHCMLVPYWSSVLGKARLRAHQVSRRGGELWCTFEGKRVRIAGHAVTYSAGMIVAG
jgi:predicted PhzF superfamily epimerase YddE/YHI9